MSFNVYIGPYAVIPHVYVAPAITVQACKEGCSSDGTRAKASKPKFCELCGATVQYLAGTGPRELRRFTGARIPDEFCDLMFTPEHSGRTPAAASIWLPNQRGLGLNLRESNSDQFPLELPVDDLASRELFETQYGKMLAYIEAEHGIHTTRGFGIVGYSY